MKQNYKSVEKCDLISLLMDLPPVDVLDFSNEKFDEARGSIGSGKRLQIWTDHKRDLDFLLAEYLNLIKRKEVRITAGNFLKRFKEKEAIVFLDYLVRSGVGQGDNVKIGENAAKQLKRYILWAIEYKNELFSNKTSVKPTETRSINPEPSPWVYYTQG